MSTSSSSWYPAAPASWKPTAAISSSSPSNQHHHDAPAAPTPQYQHQGEQRGVSPTSPQQQFNAKPALAATGRKRKRLQRACVSCHKAKRRCDGGLPCSNCDFSGRSCTYSDAQGNAVAPTQRTNAAAAVTSEALQRRSTSASAASQEDGQSSTPPPAQQQQQPLAPRALVSSFAVPSYQIQSFSRDRSHSTASHGGVWQPHSPRHSLPSSDAWTASSVQMSAEQRRELLSLFFTHLQPFSSCIDEISFLRDLSTDDVSPVLLLAVYALTARFQSHDVTADKAWSTGEVFARAARRLLHEEDVNGNTLIDGDAERADVDTAFASCFLAAHELGMGRTSRASIYLGHCARLCRALRLASGVVPAPKRDVSSTRAEGSASASRASARRAGNMAKFTCTAMTLDVVVSMLGTHPAAFVSADMAEAYVNFEHNAPLMQDESIAALVRCLGSVALLSRAIEARRSATVTGSNARANAEIDAALNAWAASLPRASHFNATNLEASAKALASANDDIAPPSPASMDAPAPQSAWCWIMMHAAAECTTYVLFEHKRAAAAENVDILLHALGSFGMRSPFALLPLVVATIQANGLRRPNEATQRAWAELGKYWAINETTTTHLSGILAASSGASPHSARSPLPLALSAPSTSSASTSFFLPPPSALALGNGVSFPSTTSPRGVSPPRERDAHKLARHVSLGGGGCGGGGSSPLPVFAQSGGRLPALRLSPAGFASEAQQSYAHGSASTPSAWGPREARKTLA